MKSLKYEITIVILAVLIIYSNTNAQNYFPLEVGNRWDYTAYYQTPTGIFYYDLVVEVKSKTKLANGKDYFVLSNAEYLFDSEYLRMSNDSLFCFDIQDSIDCLLFAFNQKPGSTYQSCKYDSVRFRNESNDSTFGLPDTEQYHFYYVPPQQLFEFSKSYGILECGYANIMTERWYNLAGCIISGRTYGTLLGINDNNKGEPLTFHLNQNYPNPFNPSTTISYSIPKASFVSIKVYDVIGREVETLVNKNETTGNYSVNFNASGLSSGIYFYQLKAGDYIQTRKMILLK